ncbi:hypothetical protein L218DRAFT_1001757 [Marasmius fiardii PR-910]|nr:hypothetical protein L218DRAFT_1001757 [Marasmius fiardii PR-910]
MFFAVNFAPLTASFTSHATSNTVASPGPSTLTLPCPSFVLIPKSGLQFTTQEPSLGSYSKDKDQIEGLECVEKPPPDIDKSHETEFKFIRPPDDATKLSESPRSSQDSRVPGDQASTSETSVIGSRNTTTSTDSNSHNTTTTPTH